MSTKIADILCQKELINESDKEIYAFGYEVILDNVTKLIAIFLAGVILHKTILDISDYVCSLKRLYRRISCKEQMDLRTGIVSAVGNGSWKYGKYDRNPKSK